VNEGEHARRDPKRDAMCGHAVTFERVDQARGAQAPADGELAPDMPRRS